ncbi:MAG: TIGR02206 family membrane protein [Clostridia bacterium]|nr:TIGR02206 family membrane protein [Clostridia bacterium]
MTTEYFWKDSSNIHVNVGFEHFGEYHLCWLAFTVVATVMLSLIYSKLHKKARGAMLIGIASFMLLTECFRQVLFVVNGSFEVGCLPLHLCGLNIFVCFIYSLTRREIIGEALYALSMPGAAMALLFPDWNTSYPPLNFFCIHSFYIHLLLFAFPLILIFNGEVRPKIKNLPKICAAILLLCPFIYLINVKFDTNFMFLNYPGEGNPLELFEKYLGNPGYLLGMPVIAAVVWSILYLPFFIKKKK